MNSFNCKRFIYLFLAVMLASCIKEHKPPKETFVQEEYDKFYRVTELNVSGSQGVVLLLPALVEANAEKAAIVSYYGDKAVYKGRQCYHVSSTSTRFGYAPCPMSAVDWRITEIDLIALNDWDSTHPEGASLKDLFSLKYVFNDSVITIPLNEFTFGDFMLSDTPYNELFDHNYYPVPRAEGLFGWAPVLFFEGDFDNTFPSENGIYLPEANKHLKVCIKDAFGGVYECEF